MPAPFVFSDADRGLKALTREARKHGAIAVVGLLGPKAAAPKKPGKGTDPKQQTRNPPTLAQVGAWNEFGSGNIPKRSFIGAWFDENLAPNQALARGLALMRLAGKLDYEKSLKVMIVRAVGGIQKRIAAGISPANAASTIRRKKSSKPLINTGQLRSSISGKVVNEGAFGQK